MRMMREYDVIWTVAHPIRSDRTHTVQAIQARSKAEAISKSAAAVTFESREWVDSVDALRVQS